MTQFYLTLNWINRNVKFICPLFEVCIKVLKSWHTGTTCHRKSACVCVFNSKPRIVNTSNMCRTGTGGYCKKFSQLFHWFTFLLLRILFIRPTLNSNFSTKFYILLNISWHLRLGEYATNFPFPWLIILYWCWQVVENVWVEIFCRLASWWSMNRFYVSVTFIVAFHVNMLQQLHFPINSFICKNEGISSKTFQPL